MGRHVERVIRDKMTLNEEISFDPEEFLYADIDMIPVEELKPSVVKKVKPTPRAVVDIPYEEQFDHTNNGQWWMNQKKKTPPNTDAIDKWLAQQTSKGSGKIAFALLVIAITGILAGVSIVIQ